QPWTVYDDLALCPAHPRYGPLGASGVARMFTADPASPLPTVDLVALGKRASTGVVPEPLRLVALRSYPYAAPVLLGVPGDPLPLMGGDDGLPALGVADFIGIEDDLADDGDTIRRNRR